MGGQGRGHSRLGWGVKEWGHSWLVWGVREGVTVGGGSEWGSQLVSVMVTVSVCEAVPTRTVLGQQ